MTGLGAGNYAIGELSVLFMPDCARHAPPKIDFCAGKRT